MAGPTIRAGDGAIIELGEVLMAEGDLAGARAKFDESMAMRQKVGAADLVAENQVEFAALSMEEGHPESAEPVLRVAISEFEKEKVDPDASPKRIDLDKGAGQFEPGVYQLDGDTLTWCRPLSADRPASVQAAAGVKCFVF